MKPPAIYYEPSTDTLHIELRPWPGEDAGPPERTGGEDAGEDLVVHYARDGRPWAWEIERASRHPEHIAAALKLIQSGKAQAAE
ncbi:MAG: hypothetical protein HYR63_07805 [Proteobacteria bacterium]|nr:hypothetical protein [Pseudomonadota bacterium]MBI3497801.1 hypothetical protein [Pseudomonadota bacterium]